MQNLHQNFGHHCFKPWKHNYALVLPIILRPMVRTEQVNQVIGDILSAYCTRDNRSWWIQYLPLVEYAYNASFHQSVGMAHFKALYGQDWLSPLNFSDPTIWVEASKEMMAGMDEQLQAVRKDIKAAQDRQKEFDDTKCSERVFKEGDKVLLRVRPKKSSLSFGRYKKLSPRYCGPYKIVKCISKQSYKF